MLCKEITYGQKSSRTMIKLKSTESHHIYYSEKSRANTKHRLNIKKYDPTLCRHVTYREEP